MYLRKVDILYRFYSTCYKTSKKLVLGIESSCDDTGAAVVDESGRIIGEALNSQHLVHLRNGGIIPPIAMNLHKENIEKVVTAAMYNGGVDFQQLDAIAVTTTPGLPLSLNIGTEFAKQLAKKFKKPLISINHMEAHALTVRMVEKVEFPFLVLLISGGHCILSVAENVQKFWLLGETLDSAPGEVLDKSHIIHATHMFQKVARRLKLRNLPECSEMNGGQAIEFKARTGNPNAYEYHNPLYKMSDCNFSFSGFRSKAEGFIEETEKRHGIWGGEVIPNIEDFCASFQYAITMHLIKRLHRAICYCTISDLFCNASDKLSLVVSGGVACNQFIRAAINQLCDDTGVKLYCPPLRLCTDNGIMIAWNGIEKLNAGIGTVEDIDSLEVVGKPKCPLGVNISYDVSVAGLRQLKFKLTFPVHPLEDVQNTNM